MEEQVIDAPGDAAPPPRPQSRWWFVAGTVAVGVVGLASSRNLGTSLDADVVSDVRTVLAALSAFSILCLGAQLVLVGSLAASSPGRLPGLPSSWRTTALIALLCSMCAAAVAIFAIDAELSFRLEIGSAAGISVGLLVLAVPPRAVLLGDEQWLTFVAIGIVATVPTLVMTTTTLGDGRPFAILSAVVIGEFIATTLSLVATASRRVGRSWPSRIRRHLRVGLAGSVGFGLLLLLMSTSSRARIGDDVVGYGQSASVARTIFLVLFSVAFVFFPSVAKAPLGSVRLRRAFHDAIGLAAALAVVAVVAVSIAPSFFVSLVANGDEADATTVRVLALAFAATGVAVVPLMQYIAHGSRMALWAWPLVVPMAAGHLLVEDATALALVALGCGLVLSVAVTWPALVRVQPVLHPEVIDHPRADGDHVPTGTSVIVPSYNPGPAVTSTVAGILGAFDDAGLDVRVIVVSDGSTDGSPELIDAIDDSRVLHLRHDRNRGKGAAIRTGLAESSTAIVSFIDADGDLSPLQLAEMVRIQNETSADIVFGSKRHSESTVDMPPLRKVTSAGYRTLVRVLFQLDIPDTQTGIKVFSRSTIDRTLPVLREEGFALDLEMFVAARAAGLSNFVEVPVELVREGTSTISSRSVLYMLGHTLAIFWRAKVMLQYLRASPVTTDVAIEYDRVPKR